MRLQVCYLTKQDQLLFYKVLQALVSPFTSLKWLGLHTARYLSIVEAITKKMEQHMLILSSVKEIKMQ